MKLLYVSNGNIPSRWAHTIQTMMMAEALAHCVSRFALLIGCDARGLLRGNRSLFEWYGISRPFRVRRLPLGWSVDPSVFESSNVRSFALRARRYARLERPRLIYTRCHESALFGLEDGFPVVFETHDGPGHPKTMRFIQDFAGFPNLAGIVTTSDVLAQAFVSKGIAEDKVLVRANAADLRRAAPERGDRGSARERLGLDRSRFLVVYVGSLHPRKGIPTLLEAARHLPDVDFLLIGGDSDQVARWSARAADAPNVRLRGFVPHGAVPCYLAAADACVVPNSKDHRTALWTFPLKLREYQVARRPTIVSAIPSLRSVVVDGEDALVVPPDEPKALADAIRRLEQDPSLAERIAARGFEKVQSFSWDARARDVLQSFAPDLLKPARSSRA